MTRQISSINDNHDTDERLIVIIYRALAFEARWWLTSHHEPRKGRTLTAYLTYLHERCPGI